ncbi:molybdopterin synthase sulfur carrier subunit-like isoform X2 [Phoenix dactylifera]|uniref:Molybdopterin synthase sulfur carrier subunit n=1 Tax=Phoenix dactylifera TaxID=42345 RepID=A0A8B8ZR86_PHODC|nr:molybdopterin synthase sulfur carrier subunit isoform X1 [Phoenix dactylifera]XP_038974018.1 molybdopterin synthase sulfur carrier subunit-like isoform X2 [Phoenix dactylifera]
MRDLNITSVIPPFQERGRLRPWQKNPKKTSDMAEMEVGPLIQVKVLFFARARELTGLTDISLLMPPRSTARDCMSKLLNKFPKLEEIYNSMVVALNEEYAPESTVLRNSDELAIIPPISGG